MLEEGKTASKVMRPECAPQPRHPSTPIQSDTLALTRRSQVSQGLVVRIDEVAQLELGGVLSTDVGGELEVLELVQGATVFDGPAQLGSSTIRDLKFEGAGPFGDGGVGRDLRHAGRIGSRIRRSTFAGGRGEYGRKDSRGGWLEWQWKKEKGEGEGSVKYTTTHDALTVDTTLPTHTRQTSGISRPPHLVKLRSDCTQTRPASKTPCLTTFSLGKGWLTSVA